MSDHSDLSGREKARLMERNLQVHNERRRALGIERAPQDIRTPWDRSPDAAPAPAFYRNDQGLIDPASRPPSYDPERRAARYRDGLPPPPPPTAPLERLATLQQLQGGEIDGESIPTALLRASNRPAPQLIPQEVFDQVGPVQSSAMLVTPYGNPPLRGTAGATYEPAVPAIPSSPTNGKLSPSQKRRMRRRKQERQEQSQPAQTPQTSSDYYPGQPVEPTDPTLDIDAPCNTPAHISLSGLQITLVCLLKPWPHIGQPHIASLPGSGDALEVFVGWFGPGE